MTIFSLLLDILTINYIKTWEEGTNQSISDHWHWLVDHYCSSRVPKSLFYINMFQDSQHFVLFSECICSVNLGRKTTFLTLLHTLWKFQSRSPKVMSSGQDKKPTGNHQKSSNSRQSYNYEAIVMKHSGISKSDINYKKDISDFLHLWPEVRSISWPVR